jgi:hypothetical protein
MVILSGAGLETKKRTKSTVVTRWELGRGNIKELKCPCRQQLDGI